MFLIEESEDFLQNLTLRELYDIYDDLNRRYFSNELPKIPLHFNRKKNIGGSFQCTYDRRRREIIDVKGIFISKYFDRTYEELIGIMLHEMAHVYMAMVEGLVDENHGILFRRLVRDLEAKSGVKVDEYKGDNWKISEKIESKTFDVFVYINNNTKTKSIAVFKEDFFRVNGIRNLEDLNRYYTPSSDRELYVIRSNDRELMEYPVKRKFTGETYRVSEDLLKRLFLDGDIILKWSSAEKVGVI